MDRNITTVGGLTIGRDLGDKHTVGCVLSTSGAVLETFTVATTMSALGRTLAGFESSRVILGGDALSVDKSPGRESGTRSHHREPEAGSVDRQGDGTENLMSET